MSKKKVLTEDKRNGAVIIKRHSSYIAPSPVTDSQESIKNRIAELNKQIKELRIERGQLRRLINPFITEGYEEKPYTLYALRLNGGYWYIGIAKNIEKRFKQHLNGKGAMWTSLHKPIAVHETRVLDTNLMSEAAVYEDELTLDYARNYGHIFVRGGGYCQMSPIWPDDITQ